jgi:hypothetical protein
MTREEAQHLAMAAAAKRIPYGGGEEDQLAKMHRRLENHAHAIFPEGRRANMFNQM